MTTSLPGEGQTSEKVADLATSSTDQNLHNLTLIGILGSETSPKAMLRLGSGRVVTVKPGDRIGLRKVAAIDTDSILLTGDFANRRLTLPGT
ncbi:amidophosphoribosyltransferase [Chachezhania antarctica]|uniref:amidophosphoribosyltransferase n=1 Tax=Chachezhania antarctica TaxID=2340860 RepID=UPI000EAF7D25|nr:amidophosphoribosyltransferase [Chachezhania antarctica]|tara:strand:+ start:1420 stop:1695 length:276 start_codon:yes stop_codon:yes gene_type:complete